MDYATTVKLFANSSAGVLNKTEALNLGKILLKW